MPQIAHFQVEKLKSSPPWEEGHPPPTPSPRSVATLPRKDCAPPNVLAHYATDIWQTFTFRVQLGEHMNMFVAYESAINVWEMQLYKKLLGVTNIEPDTVGHPPQTKYIFKNYCHYVWYLV